MELNLTDMSATLTSCQDRVMPFVVPALSARGRIIRLNESINTIITGHDYDPVTARILAEAVAVSALLGSALKSGSRFILQISADQDIATLIADYRSPQSETGSDASAGLRAYVRHSETGVLKRSQGEALSPHLGTGTMALTIDLGQDAQRYQGIVAIEGKSITDAALSYFENSEQIPSFLKLSIAEEIHKGKKAPTLRLAGVLLQHMPNQETPQSSRVDTPTTNDEQNDGATGDQTTWDEARIRIQTVEDKELLDDDLGVDQLVHRLFHDYGYEVYSGMALAARCSCSEDKIKDVIAAFSSEEREAIKQQNIEDDRAPEMAEVVCEFCSTQYLIPLALNDSAE